MAFVRPTNSFNPEPPRDSAQLRRSGGKFVAYSRILVVCVRVSLCCGCTGALGASTRWPQLVQLRRSTSRYRCNGGGRSGTSARFLHCYRFYPWRFRELCLSRTRAYSAPSSVARGALRYWLGPDGARSLANSSRGREPSCSGVFLWTLPKPQRLCYRNLCVVLIHWRRLFAWGLAPKPNRSIKLIANATSHFWC